MWSQQRMAYQVEGRPRSSRLHQGWARHATNKYNLCQVHSLPLPFGVSEIKIIKPMVQSLPSQLVMTQLIRDTEWTAVFPPDALSERKEKESIIKFVWNLPFIKTFNLVTFTIHLRFVCMDTCSVHFQALWWLLLPRFVCNIFTQDHHW